MTVGTDGGIGGTTPPSTLGIAIPTGGTTGGLGTTGGPDIPMGGIPIGGIPIGGIPMGGIPTGGPTGGLGGMLGNTGGIPGGMADIIGGTSIFSSLEAHRLRRFFLGGASSDFIAVESKKSQRYMFAK